MWKVCLQTFRNNRRSYLKNVYVKSLFTNIQKQWNMLKISLLFKDTVMQIEKGQIIDRLRVSKVS